MKLPNELSSPLHRSHAGHLRDAGLRVLRSVGGDKAVWSAADYSATATIRGALARAIRRHGHRAVRCLVFRVQILSATLLLAFWVFLEDAIRDGNISADGISMIDSRVETSDVQLPGDKKSHPVEVR